MRDYIARLLGGQHDIDTVGDGEAALASIRARRPDLLLTDIMMPKLDGFGLIKAIRDDAALRDLPIIVLSARAGEEARVEGLVGGRRRLSGQTFLRTRDDRAHRRRAGDGARAPHHGRCVARGSQVAGNPQSRRLDSRRGTRSGQDRATGHRRRHRTHRRAIRLVLLQRDRRQGRELHALHPVRRAARGVLEIPDAAQHRRVRADLRRQRHRAQRRHHQGSALRQERAASRHAEGPSAGAQLSRRAGHLALGRSARRIVLRPFRGRRFHRTRRSG